MSHAHPAISYCAQVTAELCALAHAGHGIAISGETESGEAAFIMAVGKKQAAVLIGIIKSLETNPDWLALREEQGKTVAAGLLDPSRS